MNCHLIGINSALNDALYYVKACAHILVFQRTQSPSLHMCSARNKSAIGHFPSIWLTKNILIGQISLAAKYSL